MNVFIYVAFASIPIGGVAVTIEFLGPLALFPRAHPALA